MKKLAALRQGVTRDLRTIVIATAVASAVTAAPAVAAMVANSDKVDGRHAVGSATPVDARAGKLVATDKRSGKLPNDIIAKAPDSERLDGLDATDLRVSAGGKEGGFVNMPGCSDAPLLSYPLEVTRKAHVWASASSWLAVLEADIKPTMYTELLDSAGEVVARSSRATHTGGGGNWGLETTTLLFSVADSSKPYAAAPGSYTLRSVGDNFGSCDNERFNQYGDPRLSHLLVPTVS